MYHGPGQEYVQAELLPPDPASVDWQHKPSSFKLYQNCARLPLPYGMRQDQHIPAETALTPEQIGNLLLRGYGLQQQYCVDLGLLTGTPFGFNSRHLRRSVPSGGALFPCEIYLFMGEGQPLPAGIYHYDVAHHALDILAQNDVTAQVSSSLATPTAPAPACILALSCFFWKDGFKYGAFSYRLQGFDLGTVIAQYIAVLNQHAISATVHYQFLDTTIDALLGLHPQHESVYALITLDSIASLQTTPTVSEAIQPREIPSIPEPVSIGYWPLVEELHQAALITDSEGFRAPRCLPALTPPPATMSYELPPVNDTSTPGLLDWCHQRHSTNGRFVPLPINTSQLARLCKFSMSEYTNDLDGQTTSIQHALLYCVINRVEDIPPGIYLYNQKKHSLDLVVAGDMRAGLQDVQYPNTCNAFDWSVCFFVNGNYAAGFQQYGDRWHRVQNMEAGIIVQRLYLTAAALQLGCRASLGFQRQMARALLHLPTQQHALIQIAIGPETHPYGYYAQPLC